MRQLISAGPVSSLPVMEHGSDRKTRVRRGARVWLALAAAVFALLAGSGLYLAVRNALDERRQQAAKQRAGQEFSRLSRCLVADTSPGATVGQRMRWRVLALASQPPEQQAGTAPSQWPGRCLPYAERLLTEARAAGLDEVAGPTAMLVQNKLNPEPRLLFDSLWEAAAQHLPAVHSDDEVPAPPAGAPPVLSSLKPVFHWDTVIVPLAGFSQRFLLPHAGSICSLRDDPPPHALVLARISSPPGVEGGSSLHLGVAEKGAPSLVFNWHAAAWRTDTAVRVGGDRTMNTYARADGSFVVLDREKEKGQQGRHVLLRCPAPSGGAPARECRREVLPLGWGGQFEFIDDHLVWRQAEKLMIARLFGPDDNLGQAVDLGSVPSGGWAAMSCRSEDRIALLYRTSETSHLALAAAGEWSTLRPVANGHSLSCHRHGATVTGFVQDGAVQVVQTSCTQASCATRRFPLATAMREHVPAQLEGSLLFAPRMERSPLHTVQVADLDGKLLLVWSHGETGGLRMRLAPIEEMEHAQDVVLFDPAEEHGVGQTHVVQLIQHGATALVLFESWLKSRAFVVDSSGKATGVGVVVQK
ncbi:MAG: hypothetical protein HY898_15530 [Deltaproteobacteria bacterium]|nr:hypothetical protein [Deltaproteobacteria bacterium]